ncbi:uncharacterized protein LOC142615912 [Castanea sativa]|uniref:uncharacterized protein LOC142615912 n=1 Tax=Castanea sativa TaxID=21020 RepID=UPI003F64C0F1
MPSRFTRPPFNSYTGRTDPVEHVSHCIQMMSLHAHNDVLMCKVFPSSLSLTTLRWFNGLRKDSIHSFSELIQEFGVRFMTCSRVPQPVDVLLSMKMGAGETFRNYANRYWDLYNEIGEGNEKIAVSTFRMGLPDESGLRESLTKRPSEDMRQLMRRIEEYKRLEDNQLQNKGKAPVINYPRNIGFQPRPWKDLRIQESGLGMGEVNVASKELVHGIVDRINNEPYFKWLNKMAGDPSRRNQNMYYTYHKDKGHTIEQCWVLKDHLKQLVMAGHLKEFVVATRNQEARQADRLRGNPLPPLLKVIEVIHAVPKSVSASRTRGIMAVVLARSCAGEHSPRKKLRYVKQPIAFDDDDMEGTIQPHNDALVVTARIKGFAVKRIMIDQGSGANVMYPDLYRELGLKKEDLSKYDTPLMGFDGHMVISEGQISLLVSTEGKEVIVTFIVVASFSLYTTILGRPWIHDMGAVPSTLHVKVKFRTEDGITVVKGNQQVARQCLVAVASRETRKRKPIEKTPL